MRLRSGWLGKTLEVVVTGYGASRGVAGQRQIAGKRQHIACMIKEIL
jgi:hypothetical protein